MPSPQAGLLGRCAALLLVSLDPAGSRQVQSALERPSLTLQTGARAAAARETGAKVRSYPELADITASTGIHFEHVSSPEQKFIVEPMSVGVAPIDTLEWSMAGLDAFEG